MRKYDIYKMVFNLKSDGLHISSLVAFWKISTNQLLKNEQKIQIPLSANVILAPIRYNVTSYGPKAQKVILAKNPKIFFDPQKSKKR